MITEKKVLLAAGAEKKEADLRTIARLQNDLNVNESEVARKSEEIVACEKQMAELSAAVEADQTALQSLYRELASCETVLAELKEKRAQEDERLKVQENEIRDIKKKLDDLRRQMNELEMQCREGVLNIENLQKAVAEKHSVDLAAMMADFTMLDDEKIAELGALLEKDKQIIDNFGEVNLLALNEYAELDQRNQFLTTQLADLNESLASLQRTITRINKISRERFAETFAAVNECFQKTFAHIFPGGRGNLLLTDEMIFWKPVWILIFRFRARRRKASACCPAVKNRLRPSP